MGKPKSKRPAGADAAAKKGRTSGWSPSTFSANGLRKLRAAGLLSATAMIAIPGEEMIPRPEKGYRVMFSQFLLRSLSLAVHEFLRGLLFVYGVQLHQLTPNSILHIACFVTLCECFLGIDPH
jgi:hypothetical protein